MHQEHYGISPTVHHVFRAPMPASMSQIYLSCEAQKKCIKLQCHPQWVQSGDCVATSTMQMLPDPTHDNLAPAKERQRMAATVCNCSRAKEAAGLRQILDLPHAM